MSLFEKQYSSSSAFTFKKHEYKTMDNKMIGIYPKGLKLYKIMIFQIIVRLRQPKFKKIVCEW